MKISVGIPFYNAGEYFKDAIQSVLSQSFADFELILLDDGSTDDSLSIARSFSDKRIRVLSDGENKGLPARLNQLIDISRGEYIARMDADDLILPDKFEKQVALLDGQPHIQLVTTGLCSITNENKVLGYRLARGTNHEKYTVSDVIFGKADIAHATIMARKSWYYLNRYNEEAKLMEDYQLWIDAAINNSLNVGYLQEPLYFYREQSSVSSAKAINAYKNQFKLILSNYFSYLSAPHKIKFTALTALKILIVFSLNIIGKSNKLLKLRNNKTKQNLQKLNTLQEKLNALNNLHDHNSIDNLNNLGNIK